MCFRPAATVTIIKCTECGTFNKPTDPTCKKCGASLDEARRIAEEAIKNSTPAQPAEISLKPKGLDDAPKAPGAPKPPTAPGAPKPPQA